MSGSRLKAVLLSLLEAPVPLFKWWCCWWQLLPTFLKLVFKMTLCFNADGKILHSGDQFQSLRNSAISHTPRLMDASGDKRSCSCFRATASESAIWLNSFRAYGFGVNQGSAKVDPLQHGPFETLKNRIKKIEYWFRKHFAVIPDFNNSNSEKLKFHLMKAFELYSLFFSNIFIIITLATYTKSPNSLENRI